MSLAISSMCEFNKFNSNAVVFLVFMISFIFFRVISNKKPLTEEKIKEGEEYMIRHHKENEDFFYQYQ